MVMTMFSTTMIIMMMTMIARQTMMMMTVPRPLILDHGPLFLFWGVTVVTIVWPVDPAGSTGARRVRSRSRSRIRSRGRRSRWRRRWVEGWGLWRHW